MDLLLDTHTYLWFINDDPRLSETAARHIENPAARVRVSVVTAWEIAIKVGTGKLVLDRPLARLWPESLAENDFDPLDVRSDHVMEVAPLPLHHRDPFDRLLIAQAIAERLMIVSADSVFDAYPVERIW